MSRKSHRSRRVKQSNANLQLHRTYISKQNYADLFGHELLSDMRSRTTSLNPFRLDNIFGDTAQIGYRVKPVLKYVRDTRRLGISASWRNPIPKLNYVSESHFIHPETSIVCIRRNRRRSVLFAFNRVGAGSGHRLLRKPRYNELSKVSCRRS